MKKDLYSPNELEELSKLEDAIRVQLSQKPKRLTHVLAVADCSEELALLYDVSCFEARAAALLHDWWKALPDSELVEIAHERGIDLGVDLSYVAPLLHGILAAQDIPVLFPELSDAVVQAVQRHTTAALSMDDLDMVLFVADAIEPNRGSTQSIDDIRELVGKTSLFELYRKAFISGVTYVLETQRYLWPTSVDIYNQLIFNKNIQEDE